MLEIVVCLLCFLVCLLVVWFHSLEEKEKQAVNRQVKRNLSYYASSAFAAAAADCAGDRIHAPLVSDLLLMRPGQVEQKLGLDEKKHARIIIDRIVRVLHDEFRPMEIRVGGSFKKNTALKFRSDIDMTMILVRFSSSDLSSYYDRAQAALQQAFGSNVDFRSDRRKPFYVLTFVVAAGLSFDVVTTGDPQQKSSDAIFYSAATSHIADTAIREFGDSHHLFRALALLCKYWAYNFEPSHEAQKRPKSYFIELFVMEALSRSTSNASLGDVFCRVLSLLKCPSTCVKNLNPNAEPQLISLDGQKWSAFRAYASNTLDSISSDVRDSTMSPKTGRHRSLCEQATELMEDYHVKNETSLIENEACRAEYEEPSRVRHAQNDQEWDGRFWEGDHRYVSKGVYREGRRSGHACVVKWFKTGSVYESSFFDKDLLAVRQASVIVDSFNHVLRMRNPSWPYIVKVNSPQVWEVIGRGEKKLVEPFLERFKKFNSNTGMSDADEALMQALSHFSYHISDSRCLLCDVQGCPPPPLARSPTYVLTDPVICSVSRSYGPLDLGKDGIENFFYYHKCGRHCSPHWVKARGVCHFRRSWGSYMQG
ncbi:unnamed protein product [Prorocentrum cordatum]|uniref:Alpha-type protein kinase domain-containing protein n=1 Tax=Prorocentrum cordatum TaxID=2364126 RepID=A0ABN9W6D7_9DINO|nr:unnamed protein product [Polarella glacialis]